MYIVTIMDQLGNQMFAYAAIKCLALKKGVKFGIVRYDCKENFSNDAKYGRNIMTVFSIPQEEIITKVPDDYDIFYESHPVKRPAKRTEENLDRMESVRDSNMLFNGHFVSCKYFTRPLSEIQSWFQLPEDIVANAKRDISEIKKSRTGGQDIKTCSVHFRLGNDYLWGGYLMNPRYFEDAADLVRKKYLDCAFVVFYDKKTKQVERFIEKYSAEEMHGSLVEDMARIAECDAHIVCNSSFSIMSVLISKYQSLVVRPKRYYAGMGCIPADAFSDDWTSCECSRDLFSYFLGTGKTIYRKIKKLVRK